MITSKFREALEKYHIRKWFPDESPDALHEFSDSITEDTLREPAVATYLLRILPVLRFPDLYSEFQRAMTEPLKPGVLPEFAYYFIRSSPEEESNGVWRALRQWCEEWETVLSDWLHSELSLQEESGEPALRKILEDTRELFSWTLQTETHAESLPQLLRFFRYHELDTIAHWTDFHALAKTIVELEDLNRHPRLKPSDESAMQRLFPIDPPHRVLLHHGMAAGPIDALRFMVEFGRGCFYAGMDPDLEFEKRITGDERLPYFWGYVHAFILGDQNCLQQLIGPRGEETAPRLRLFLHFWFRYDALLSLFRDSTRANFGSAQDFYIASFALAFPFQAPAFLHLYELGRSNEATARALSLQAAAAAVERFRELYGKRWFSNKRFSQKMRDYWRPGFTMTLEDLMNDLGIANSWRSNLLL